MIGFPQGSTVLKPGETSEKKEVVNRMSKYNSEPKFTSLKDEIMKIPKVKQILQKDRFVYSQDIEKRVQLLGSVKNDNYAEKEVMNLHGLGRKVQKKTKRHKTNFKIPLTRNNMASLNSLMKDHIVNNQFYKNQERIFLKEYEQSAPFDLQKMKFMDELNPLKVKYKERFPDFKEGVLAKNKLVLERVILNRNLKREMKLDQRKVSKQNGKRIFDSMK